MKLIVALLATFLAAPTTTVASSRAPPANRPVLNADQTVILLSDKAKPTWQGGDEKPFALATVLLPAFVLRLRRRR